MSIVGKVVRGRARVRCDGCGRISSDKDGYYLDRETNRGGTISSKGRECEHDYCDQCEARNPPPIANEWEAGPCPKCALTTARAGGEVGAHPLGYVYAHDHWHDPTKPCSVCGDGG